MKERVSAISAANGAVNVEVYRLLVEELEKRRKKIRRENLNPRTREIRQHKQCSSIQNIAAADFVVPPPSADESNGDAPLQLLLRPRLAWLCCNTWNFIFTPINSPSSAPPQLRWYECTRREREREMQMSSDL